MGLPLNTSPLFLFADLIFNLQVNILKFDQTMEKSQVIFQGYHQDIGASLF